MPADVQLFGGGLSHSSSPRSAILLFEQRSSSACSTTASFRSRVSQHSCLTSSVVSARP